MKAVPPFKTEDWGFGGFPIVKDANGSLVIVCGPGPDAPCALYAEREVEKDGHFTCPTCGRLGQRMVEATPEQVEAFLAQEVKAALEKLESHKKAGIGGAL